jgi:hypothetical protein
MSDPSNENEMEIPHMTPEIALAGLIDDSKIDTSRIADAGPGPCRACRHYDGAGLCRYHGSEMTGRDFCSRWQSRSSKPAP